jgi:3-dehydroquinate dehydratase-2
MRVLVLNGPNLGRLGTREPAVYGTATYADLETACAATASELGMSVDVRQTDDEATMLAWLHELADGSADALVLNPAAWTHTSVALRDAVAQLSVPFVEVHLSNPLAREEFRHTSYTAGLAVGVIAGFGVESYRLALRALAARRGEASQA